MAGLNSRFRCMQCDHVEDKCSCDRFCALCQSLESIRLCADGNYYCQPCREVCDYSTE